MELKLINNNSPISFIYFISPPLLLYLLMISETEYIKNEFRVILYGY